MHHPGRRRSQQNTQHNLLNLNLLSKFLDYTSYTLLLSIMLNRYPLDMRDMFEHRGDRCNVLRHNRYKLSYHFLS